MKKILYGLEAFFVYLIYGLMKILPVTASSAFCGFIFRTIGPLISISKVAKKNLALAFPDKTEKERHQILCNMWTNIGRVIGEYPHLKAISERCLTITNKDIVEHHIQRDRGCVFVGAHIGNWELYTSGFITYFPDIPISFTYRRPNNPWVADFIEKIRVKSDTIQYIAKSNQSARELMRAAKSNQSMAILIDQKNNEGVPVPFFGSDAMTNPTFIQLAQKYNMPIVLCRMIRKNKTRFEIELDGNISALDPEGSARPVEDVLNDIHQKLEHWITEHPDQWLWIHNRWPKDAHQKNP